MIYGLIPVGGTGSRLGLPFPKELLPLKNYSYYHPVIKLTVDNMLLAGCEKIIFVHGAIKKKEIINLYNTDKFEHISNKSARQSEVFTCFYKHLKKTIKNEDFVLYGLPDTFYKDNVFIDMIQEKGSICCMFSVHDKCIVGRLNKEKKFIKSNKKENLSNFCWAALKLDCDSIKKFNFLLLQNKSFEVEDLLNNIEFKTIHAGSYIDLGTWDSLNFYWNSTEKDNKNV